MFANESNSKASIDDFPKFDSLHAHCGAKAIFKDMNCANDLFHKIHDTCNISFKPDYFGGMYDVKEEKEGEYVWCTRTSPVSKFVDDIIFEL